MATTIVTKYGSDAPAASDIVRGELAVDTENGRLYTENAAGAVVEIGLKPEANVDVTGTITATGTSVFASLDISGDIDVDGTTNLDVVDIDGAVDFASTTAHAGNATFADNAKAIFGAGSDLQIYHDGNHSYIEDAGTGSIKIKVGDFRVENASGNNLIKGVGDIATLHHAGSEKLATASGGISVTGNIANASGHLTLDVVGQLIVDTEDEGTVLLKNSGTQYGNFFNQGNDFLFKSLISDGDIVFKGVDSGAQITALTLDMSDGGTASFNSHIRLGDNKTASFGAGFDIEITSDGTNGTIAAPNGDLTLDVAGELKLDADGGNITLQDGGTAIGQFQLNDSNHLKLVSKVSDADIFLQGVDGGSTITALRLDMSAAGAATFNSNIATTAGNIALGQTTTFPTTGFISHTNNFLYALGGSNGILLKDASATTEMMRLTPAEIVVNDDSIDMDFRVESNDNANMLFVDGGNNVVNIGHATNTVGASSGTLMVNFIGNAANGIKIRDTRGEAGTNNMMVFVRGDNEVGTITSTTSATAYNTSSDQRLKENIADADDAGSKIDAIQVRKFDWKVDGSHQDYGMVAQELQAVAPEAVSASENPEDMMAVDYSKLVPMLVKEIQQLRHRVAQLES